MIPTERLYAASIAIVSGVYAIGSAAVAIAGAPMMGDGLARLGIGGWIMLAIGVVVLVHGVALLTPAAARLRRTSGPLMIAWAAIMLADQWLLAMTPGGMTGSPMTAGMGWDAGMVAIAALMLISGLIMTSRRSSAM